MKPPDFGTNHTCCITLADLSGICEEHPEVLEALNETMSGSYSLDAI